MELTEFVSMKQRMMGESFPSDRARVTHQPFSNGCDRQPAIPPDTLTHQKGAPASAADMASTPESLQFRGTFSHVLEHSYRPVE
ncbi:hypothetical protein AB0H88_27180 [Nonomuraea sp. NPDC050680]|uniref:hypothetical protein n=1 Tax=Nonomuraea sp. NPDC050680 TaxID=3154630 RepID=UPI0033E1E041